MKQCRRCKQNKLENSFRKASWGGLQSWCKECESEYQRAIYASDPKKQRLRRANYVSKYRDRYNASRRENRYEIYISECSRKYKAPKEVIRHVLEKGKCDICGSANRLSIDHCHKIDQVRGLLCDDCNNLLGRAKDSIQTLKNAIKYLRKCTSF
jgi:hypothetical protein